MARAPKGGDTDQIKAVASGECQIALTNTYYLARLMRSTKPEDRAVVEKVGVVFPNQQTWGTHVNIAGAAVARHAPNRAAAVQFLEYLASDRPRPISPTATTNGRRSPARQPDQSGAATPWAHSRRKRSRSPSIGMNQAKVQQMLDRVGYK